MKRTLERELKVPEVAEREAIRTSPAPLRLSRGIVIAFVVRATGGRGGERVLRGVSWGSLSAWLGARGKTPVGSLRESSERTLVLSEVYW